MYARRTGIAAARTLLGRSRSLRLTLVLTSTALLAGLAAPLPSPAAPDSPFAPWMTTFASDYAAGAAPASLTLRFEKTPNHCVEIWGYLQGSPMCGVKDGKVYPIYEEQDFKKLAVTMAPGLAADVNAATACTPTYNPYGPPGGPFWTCAEGDAATKIGQIVGLDSGCLPDYYGDLLYACGWADPDDAWAGPIFGDVYMTQAEPGEQARLVSFVGALEGLPLEIEAAEAVFTSVKVDPHGQITATTDNIPDSVRDPVGGFQAVVSAHYLQMRLFGSVGVGTGHPFLSNPTSCGPKEFSGVAQGYAENVEPDPNFGGDDFPGHGDGRTASISDGFHAVGCNDVPYTPDFKLAVDDAAPGAVPGIKTELSQEVGEATTGSVKVVFPRGFRINFDNKAEQCTRDQFESASCPENAKIGGASAFSELLPLDLEPRRLEGDVFLGETDLAAGNIRLYVRLAHPDWLPDGIWLTGEATLQSDGSLVTVFDDLPELPMQHFEMSLEGGSDKGLLRNPKTCGEKPVDATLTTHQGRELRIEAPIRISCTEPTFDAELSSKRPGAHPTVTLTAASAGIESVSFDLSRYLKVGKRPSALESLGSYGNLSFATESGGRDLKLRLVKRGSLGSLSFSATEAGTQLTSAGSFDVRLMGKSKRRVAKRSGRRNRGPTRLWLGGLPDGTSQVSVELDGARDSFIENPSRCRKDGKRLRMGFAAHIVGTNGSRRTLQREIRMACSGKTGRARR